MIVEVELVIFLCVAVTVVWLLMKVVSSVWCYLFEPKPQQQYVPSVHPSLIRKLVVAIDTECVGVGFRGRQSMVARVSLVKCDTVSGTRRIYDKYVKPLQPVTDYRTFVSGIRPQDLLNGEDFFKVRQEVLQHIRGCRLVGHDLRNDLDVLDLWHPPEDIRDTAFCKPLRNMAVDTLTLNIMSQLCGNQFISNWENTRSIIQSDLAEKLNPIKPSLKCLAKHILNKDIQAGEHSSVEDATTALDLYLIVEDHWEIELVCEQ